MKSTQLSLVPVGLHDFLIFSNRTVHAWSVSTDYRPTIDRLSIDYRSTVDRLSTAILTECRPLHRPVCRPIHDTTYSKQDPTLIYNSYEKKQFKNIINSSVSVHLSGHIAVWAAPRFFYSAGNLPISRRFWPAWTCTLSAAFLYVCSRKQGGSEERLIGPLGEIGRLGGTNLSSVYLQRDDAARSANRQRQCYSKPLRSCRRINLSV